MNTIEKIIILGGGTSGFISAFILRKKHPNLKIQIIKSEKIDTIGVGEGSTENFTKFLEYVDIEYKDIIKNCGVTLKSGIMFKGWSDNDFLQSISDGWNMQTDFYPIAFGNLIVNKSTNDLFVSEHALNNKVNAWFLQDKNICPTAQFHFDNFKLNSYFEKLASKRNINVIYTEIKKINLSANGNIQNLQSEDSVYTADFFIDASGFRKFLIKKLDAKWKSWKKYFFLNSAITFQTKSSENIDMWTTAQTMENGWLFKIPLTDRNGNGYIYDDRYCTNTQAEQEVREFLNLDITVAKEIKFEPGYVINPWIKNCCAIGLSSSFVEPLEASSIGVTIEQSFLLSKLLVNYNDYTIKKYNTINEKILENVRDFISLHYITKKNNSQFWKDIQHNLIISDKLAHLLEIWKNNLPNRFDFFDYSPSCLFSELHFILILNGLKLFNAESITREYKSIVSAVDERIVLDTLDFQKNLRCDTIPHRLFLEFLKNIKKENYE